MYPGYSDLHPWVDSEPQPRARSGGMSVLHPQVVCLGPVVVPGDPISCAALSVACTLSLAPSREYSSPNPAPIFCYFSTFQVF